MTKGKVYLVGAGPGDAKLITIKGLECIKKADVVVYDRLASPRLLRQMKPGARKIYVGKRTERHTMKQEDINKLLVELALEGHIVVRLKGGDPTVFGRVGEEAEELRRNGIEYEIVPGITSSIAVPAYAGIPVTHRNLASSFSVITGHENPEKLDKMIKWDKVTNATGTLVFMMGVAQIGHITAQLLKHGRPASTPVALIRWGTRAEQETLTGTLADIAETVAARDFKPPAVIVVGDVVGQRERLHWAEQMPLFGRRILVTRSRSQASELVDRIEELGGEPYEFPVIETVITEKDEQLEPIRQAFAKIESYDWVFFTSVNGVDYFFRHLEREGLDIRSLHRARIAAVGPATIEALKLRGIRSEAPPENFDAEGMIAAYGQHLLPGQRALLPRGDLARSWLPEALRERGLEVAELDTYETVLTGEDDEELLDLLHDDKIHAVTFTSSSTVRNLLAVLERMGEKNAAELLNRASIACIGPQTAKTAEEAGLNVDLLAEEATIEGLIRCLCDWKAASDRDNPNS
ncbi:uroporphyrinogen-III C-methyltransferase [Saccharibacillus sp. CPCC 101409]|uniref:uroporphyrinogen-III C-methyltransferase n=1 Tax=Saccharibacillus sp. CPCC 101409 TaxID=3058041 RepID=UPI0026725CEF|nr:uroporphyrinogen-III C-methyltransferase [Saccharibacillus sp. CPCC 101409]MDO3410198.1 uroporphyrinogen-III C-methyltransferase [Saccharibacillus sp. CPCC 101409]